MRQWSQTEQAVVEAHRDVQTLTRAQYDSGRYVDAMLWEKALARLAEAERALEEARARKRRPAVVEAVSYDSDHDAVYLVLDIEGYGHHGFGGLVLDEVGFEAFAWHNCVS